MMSQQASAPDAAGSHADGAAGDVEETCGGWPEEKGGSRGKQRPGK